MKTIKSLVLAALAVVALASCEKKPAISDAVVTFDADNYEFVFESGPNYEIPIKITGENIVYPITIILDNAEETEENGYSIRNVDYRFLDREVVIESAQDKAVATVRIINEELEALNMCVTMKSAVNATVATGARAEVSTYYGISQTDGIYNVVGKKSGADYSEQWYMLTEGADFVGFWGLLGFADMDEYWPIMGDAVYDLEDNTTLMSFDFTVDNYIGAVRLQDGTVGLAAPILYDGQYVYTSETVQMLSNSEGTIQIGLPDGIMITMGMFDTKTGKFLGKVVGGFLAINNWTITRATAATSGIAPAALEPNAVYDINTKEVISNGYTVLPKETMPKNMR